MSLDWPAELTETHKPETWQQAGSNLCLDFHGDPANSNCIVFSDGNHHMALHESLKHFADTHEDARIFYATTPPNVLINLMEQGRLAIGNLLISIQPQVFIGPEASLKKLQTMGKITHYQGFMRSAGVALLVEKSNPLGIRDLADLLRPEVVIGISNPQREPASFQVYEQSLMCLAEARGLSAEAFQKRLHNKEQTRYSQCIHHREIPQMIHRGEAHVALLYYHLALRFSRIFPQQTEMIVLGNEQDPGAQHESICTDYYMGVLQPEDIIVQELVEFLQGDTVTGIYQFHGLQRP